MNIDSSISTFYPIYSPNPISPVSKTDVVTRNSGGTSVINSISKTECQTCKERKYVDGSNDSTVSFQTPTHISPSASAAVVMSHEKEHLANAIDEGSQEGKDLVSASISLQTSICPECSRTYVSGGTTRSTIATTNTSSNPYDMLRKSMEGFSLVGSYVDTVA